MSKKRLIMILIMLDIPIIIGVLLWFFVFKPPVQNFRELSGLQLDENQKYELAKGIGRSERVMWEAYYNKDKISLGKELVNVLQVQYGMSAVNALSVAEPLGDAAMAFAGSDTGYDENVLPKLKTAYAKLKEVSGMGFDPDNVAAAELAWWVARRTPGQDSPENVGKEIANFYKELYQVDSGSLLMAGRARATAANLRDGHPENPPWDEIEKMLTEGYIALITGLMAAPPR